LAQDVFGTLQRAVASKREPRAPEPPDPGRQGPHGVGATAEEPTPPNEASCVGKAMAPLMPTLLAAVHTWRTEGVRVVNTDTHPICLVDAYVGVTHVVKVSGDS